VCVYTARTGSVQVLALLVAMLLPLTSSEEPKISLVLVELGLWILVMGGAMLHFLVLGARINSRYKKNRSVLLGEQLNLQLRLLRMTELADAGTEVDMARNKAKQQQLQASFKVLELALKLFNELESSGKMQLSGVPINQTLYVVVRLLVLSIISSYLANALGIRLQLTKLAKM